jgi:sugar lactone lactonase YvrE
MHSMNAGQARRWTAPFAPLGAARARLGESPVWCARAGAIWWIDIDGRKLIRTDPGGADDVWATPEIPGFVQPGPDGAPIVGMQSGVFRFDPARGAFARIAALDAPGVRFNDACTGADGRIWAGTMDLGNARPVGTLYSLDPGGALVRQATGFLTINGLAWDGARGRLYVSDSHETVQTWWTAPVHDGRMAEGARTVFARFHDLPGRPDGAAIDAQGDCWIAGVGGGEIYRFAPDGALMDRIAAPMAFPTKILIAPGRMVLTSRADAANVGRLMVWADGAAPRKL